MPVYSVLRFFICFYFPSVVHLAFPFWPGYGWNQSFLFHLMLIVTRSCFYFPKDFHFIEFNSLKMCFLLAFTFFSSSLWHCKHGFFLLSNMYFNSLLLVFFPSTFCTLHTSLELLHYSSLSFRVAINLDLVSAAQCAVFPLVISNSGFAIILICPSTCNPVSFISFFHSYLLPPL